jgi:hypothetical protein
MNSWTPPISSRRSTPGRSIKCCRG